MKGYIQVYTGNGKGKTTAALGLALRAAGAGLQVFIGQFLKNCPYSEIKALERHADQITLGQYGTGCFIVGKPADADREAARRGFEHAKQTLLSGAFDVVILDEITIATHYAMITVQELLDLISIKPDHTELIITGRYADKQIIDRADLVTEMTEKKHYYARGVEAREGIEK
jgi:cob(I)alamin adenosyltransferase